MDENHSTNENVEKVVALFEAIMQLYIKSSTLPLDILLHHVESLKTLSEESRESFDALVYTLKSME